MTPPRRAPAWAALGVCLCAASAHAAPGLQFSETGLSPTEITASRQLLEAATARLPAYWRENLPAGITVEWRRDLPPQVHGRARARTILLDRALLDGWKAGPDTSNASITPTSRPALAALLHELAHLHDRTPQGRLSRDPRLLDLAGWQVAPLRFGLRRRHSPFTDRSPDRYELTRPAEFVAVNLEHFLLDPDYACRRPALARYFAEHLRTPVPQATCTPDLVFLQAGVKGDEPPLLQLDPERVYAVDYLLAEGNAQPMSRWGHSMLRLVICAPGRPRGPDCRLDLAHHRVLSFRAFVDDVQISSWRGLTGSYPSRMYLLPLEQVIDEYTRTELRGLQSIPLRLSRDDIGGLLERTAQLHWTYDGRYYFLSNNCAVETYKLLHDGVPRLARAPLSSITPTGLLRRLQRAGIADTSVLDDRQEARRIGYYFEAMSARYQTMFEVAKSALDLPHRKVEDWLALPPQARTPWLQAADLRTTAALLVLEEAALRRQESLARDALKRRFLERGAPRTPDTTSATRDLRDLLALEGLLSRPAALLPDGGYGLPQGDERRLLAQVVAQQATTWRQRNDTLRRQARDWLPPAQQQALETTETNLATLGQRLRHLNAEQGGWQLH